MSHPPLRSRGAAPTPRTASYPPVQPDASGAGPESRPDWHRESIPARILATLALVGASELREIRACGWMVGPTATVLARALGGLVASGRVEAVERSEIAVSADGVRYVRHFTLFSIVKGGDR